MTPGGIAPFIEGLYNATEERTCGPSCRYYRYLATLDTHICTHPDYHGTLEASDVEKDCDAWEPRP